MNGVLTTTIKAVKMKEEAEGQRSTRHKVSLPRISGSVCMRAQAGLEEFTVHDLRHMFYESSGDGGWGPANRERIVGAQGDCDDTALYAPVSRS